MGKALVKGELMRQVPPGTTENALLGRLELGGEWLIYYRLIKATRGY